MDFPHRSPMAARGADISEDCRRDLGKSVRQLRKKSGEVGRANLQDTLDDTDVHIKKNV